MWQMVEPVLFNRRRLEMVSSEIDHIVSLTGIKDGGRVLDLCCGIGRHSLELARRGYSVVGIDRTRTYIQKAQEAARNEGLDAEFVVCDMREFKRTSEFDVVISMFTSFGYFADDGEQARVLDNVFNSLKPGGSFLIDVMGKEVLARVFQATDWHADESGGLFLEKRQITDDWSIIRTEWRLIQPDGRMYVWHIPLRIYSAVEMRQMLTAAGLMDVKAYGSLSGTPYDNRAERLVMVGRRPM